MAYDVAMKIELLMSTKRRQSERRKKNNFFFPVSELISKKFRKTSNSVNSISVDKWSGNRRRSKVERANYNLANWCRIIDTNVVVPSNIESRATLVGGLVG